MVKLTTPVCEFGTKAIDFNLTDCGGKNVTLQDCVGPNGLLVMFICNHCPYVQAIIDDLVKATNNLKKAGVNTVAIMPNNWEDYPDDSPESMKELKNKYNFSFPYLVDETQQVAKKYGAVCTPDFFGYNNNLELQYRGRFDARGRDAVPNSGNHRSELEEAMLIIAKIGEGPRDQKPSMGCSIKWREE